IGRAGDRRWILRGLLHRKARAALRIALLAIGDFGSHVVAAGCKSGGVDGRVLIIARYLAARRRPGVIQLSVLCEVGRGGRRLYRLTRHHLVRRNRAAGCGWRRRWSPTQEPQQAALQTYALDLSPIHELARAKAVIRVNIVGLDHSPAPMFAER